MSVDRGDILAVLEERPYQAEALADLLEQPIAAVLEALADLALPQCEKCGAVFLRKAGSAGRYCSRVCYLTGPTSAGHPRITNAMVLEQLQRGPVGATAIAVRMQVGKKAVRLRLLDLAKTSAVKPLGRRWALSTWMPPAPAPNAPRPAPRPKAARSVRSVDEYRPRWAPRNRAMRDAEIEQRIREFWEPPSSAAPTDLPLPVAAITRLVADGIEYEAWSVGSQSVTGSAPGLGSTLSGGQFHVSKR